MNQNEASPAIDRTFLNVLSCHRGGQIVTDTSAALKQLTAAVQQTGKGGEVVLRMKLKPASAGNSATLVFEPKIKVTIPETLPAGSIFYADNDFNLVREDPKQIKMELKEAQPAQPAQLREVEAK